MCAYASVISVLVWRSIFLATSGLYPSVSNQLQRLWRILCPEPPIALIDDSELHCRRANVACAHRRRHSRLSSSLRERREDPIIGLPIHRFAMPCLKHGCENRMHGNRSPTRSRLRLSDPAGRIVLIATYPGASNADLVPGPFNIRPFQRERFADSEEARKQSHPMGLGVDAEQFRSNGKS